MPLLAALFACGPEASIHDGPPGATTDGTTGGAGGQNRDNASGEVGELSVFTVSGHGRTSERFDLDLQKLPSSTPSACLTATARVGPCCYFASNSWLPRQGFGSPTVTDPQSSAGTLTLTNDTSGAQVATFDYEGQGYPSAPANYTSGVWKPGDALRVTAAGGEIGPFTVSAPSLTPPAVDVPSTVAQAQALVIGWQPDANADGFFLSLRDADSDAAVACGGSDRNAALTVDATLLAAFKPNARLQGVATRQAIRVATAPAGRLIFSSMGWFEFDTSLD